VTKTAIKQKLKDWVVGQITGTDDIDFSATQKTSLNAATPDLTAITSDKDSYKATGFNTVTPDASGTAAGLHGTTDGKIDNVQAEVAGLDGEAMRGTDSAITSLDPITTDKDSYKATGFATPTNVTDAHTATDGKIDVTDGLIGGLNNITANNVLDAIVEGSHSLADLIRGLASANFGEAEGGDTTSIKFKSLAGTKNRITETVDANGNRTSVTLDLT